MALSADETFSARPTASSRNRARQGSLLLSIYGYAPCYASNPEGSKSADNQTLGRSSSLGIIESTRRGSQQPLSLSANEADSDPAKRSSCIEVSNCEMPKRTSTSDRERKVSTRLFRSMSISGRKQMPVKESNTTSDDQRYSTISSSDTEKVSVVTDRHAQLVGEREKAVGECNQINKDLKEANDKLQDAEREIETLKDFLSSRLKQELDNCEKDSNGTKRTRISLSDVELESMTPKANENKIIFPSKVEHLETTIEANAFPLQKSTPSTCKDCERIKSSRIRAVVEAIALRKYVKNLNEVLSEGEQSKQNFLDEVQKNLISAQTEKEVALEELATVIDQRDQAVREKDHALEEWGKATSKWENTLDQLDSIMKELSKVKVERDDLTKELKRKDDTLEQKRQETSILSEQVEVSRRKSSEFIIGEEILLRDKCEKEASVRKLSTELTKSQQRNIEMDARVTSLEEKSETFKRERDHAKEQWRQSVKERKRLNREIAAIVQARDEAIQKCFSTAEQLEKMKEEYNHLLNRLAKTGLNGNDSGELSIPCSLKECKFCENDAVDAAMPLDRSISESEEIQVTLEKDDPIDSIKFARVSMNGRPCTAITDVDKTFGHAKNVRKYDEIVSINGIPVTESDLNLVKSLLNGSIASPWLVLKRPVGPFQISLDLDLKASKKSKSGLGFECGLYVKDVKQRLIGEGHKMLEIGDYIMKINGKHLDKIIAASVEKVTKKSMDKLKLHVTRTIQARPRMCDSKNLSTTDSESENVNLGRTHRTNCDKRLSLVSNDSSISRDSKVSMTSSLGSISSNNDSSLADSNSDIYGTKFIAYGHFMPDRHRGVSAIYSPSSDPQLETIVADDWPDVRTGSSEVDGSPNTSGAKESDASDYGTLKPSNRSPMNRKFVSTSQLQSGTFLTPALVDGMLVRAQSAVAAVRVDDDDGLNRAVVRSNTFRAVTPSGENPRIIRLEKKPLDGLGLEVSGGYRVGIYVTELQESSVCKDAGLQIGDRLLKLNSYDLTKATLDHATRIVKVLSTCTYLRIEAQTVSNYEEILEDKPYDSLYVRTVHPYKAMSPDELSFTVGETLHVINTRANYDQARQSWKWVAQRMRKDAKVLEEGLVPCMGSIPEQVESTVLSQTLQRFDAENDERMSDETPSTLKRSSTERRSIMQRYRKLMKRESRDLANSTDENGNTSKVTFYEILGKISD
ncbi:PREDICTED: uncharacterized protein LOC107334614 isoform X1 [Acropora digitifera]|uniref:uncharacterized protein LOC107334614 isoform X1 n=1 Tax=Acropora digitifera TaxID=70779 RepID=UPI00077B0CB7|nr:PREDICTED: uncharacterized protein LOC107334614 isoform X1 [Acropora digitifera]